MGKLTARVSTGLEGLDAAIDGLRTGDNVVLQVDSIEDYLAFVTPFVNKALADSRRVVYIRFAGHRPLIEDNPEVVTYRLDAFTGFESFSSQVYTIATKEGEDVFYVFDCLSDLLSAWATDLMIGNFFRITCPYLYQLNTIAYFGLIHNWHSFKTIARIRETTQILIDVYNVSDNVYIHPLKVMGRHKPTMFLPHKVEGKSFLPITNSVDMGRLFTYISQRDTEESRRNLDYWDRLFLSVVSLAGSDEAKEKERMLRHLCEIMIGREERILDLACRYFTLDDLLAIKSRLIGTGYIGGKAVGMLLARKILEAEGSFDWASELEPHDSFYIGSDVFYTYIVENGWWKHRMEQKTKEGYFAVARILKDDMLEGDFPDEIEEQFWRMLEYFGQSPIIVRSSSLLEDAFGNAFAGKYESIFCVNQGSPEERFKAFREAVQRVYSSMMNEDALAYRLQRGLHEQDEQMALLVQRVSGSYRGDYFFPDMAGVGISYNTFPWKKDMDPKAGMIRIVLGLGTRAVNRVDNDYPRTVALDAPQLKPYSGMGDVRKYSQHEVDVLDIARNSFETVPAENVLGDGMNIDLEMVATLDREAGSGQDMVPDGRWMITFEKLLAEGSLPKSMQSMLKTLEKAYDYPVDIEFTVNFTGAGSYAVNLVQCRPLQTKGEGKRVRIPRDIPESRVLFRTKGSFMGGSINQRIDRIVMVDPEGYSALKLSDKYDIARLIGKINRQISGRESIPTLLVGPGRWGTTTPSLGVPVRFSEINNISVIVEIAHIGGALMPELSYGTHFFQDLVETDIFYVAVFPDASGALFNRRPLEDAPNLLPLLLPEQEKYANVVKVVDLGDAPCFLYADIIAQETLCFRP
ncbi:MAG TPA: PEP/pyruvate-binding domain-containing protein [Deltaproteobacteria bacterium]|nr:PEP/pyruvate-binding domain-containing protein [Deltaproteobacteria bacterium]HOI06278.1 PEP/pyruvate-binding domain-containing protein [Deltaproteobacteria bacterium]